MKKILSILIALITVLSVMAIAVSAAVGDVAADYAPADGSVGISSLSEITDTAGTYHLTGNITVDATYAEAFSGVLDGCGHTVTVSVPMFAEFNGTVKNMVLDGSITTTDSSAAAVAVTSTSSMTAMNITSNVDITVSGTAADLYAAAIVSKSTSTDVANTFMAIVNNGDITVNAPEGSKPRAAGIAARVNNAVFTDCMNNGTVSASGSQVVVGGICARGSNTGSTVETDFYHCVNNGNVSGVGLNAYAGGICGHNGRKDNVGVHDFVGCVNTGNISGNYRVAGIVGYVYGSTTQHGSIENCINAGSINYGGNIGTDGNPTDVCGSPFVAYTNSADTQIRNNIDIGSIICTTEGYDKSCFIGCSGISYAVNLFSCNYVTDVATKFAYFAYASADKNSANRIPIADAGTALTDTTVDYIKSEEFTNTVSGFIKTDSLPVVSSGDSWNGGEYVMAVAEHVCGGLTKVEAVAATCGDKGNIEYYTCSCGRYYKDAEANEEITDKGSVIIPIDTSISHTWGETEYLWFYDAETNIPYQCEAIHSCSICGNGQYKVGTLSDVIAITEATCTGEGKGYRTATFSVDWATTSTSEEYVIAIDPNNHPKKTNVKNNGDGTHSAVYECCNKTVEAEAHVLVQGETGYEGEYNSATALTLAVSCKICDYSEVLKSTTYSRKSTYPAYCHTIARALYRNVDFGNGIIINVTVYDPSGAFNPDRHESIDKYVDNGDCSHTIVYGCCENATKIISHSYLSGVCRYCEASQEERDSMHKWEVSYEWLCNKTTNIPYICRAIRACSICNARNTKNSTTLKTVEQTYANCQRAGSGTYTATFDVEWAETQTKTFEFAVNPSRHASGWVWNINTDGTHSQMYPCCGVVTDTAAHTYNETTKKCTACGYTEGATLYTVTFMADGKVYCTTKVCVGSIIRTPTAPAKEDSTFYGWFTEENGNGNRVTSPYNTEGDTTYYAYYRNKFNVCFDIIVNDNGLRIETLKDVLYGTTVSAPASEKYASRIPAGYYFDGWYTNQDLLTAFDFENTKITYDTWIYGKVTECTEHIWGEVAYALSDDLTSCTATRTCTRCLFAETATSVSANVTLVEAATCAKVGTATGTATFDVEWAADQSGNIELAVDPENHVNPTVTYNWTNDKTGIPNKCTATLNCSACGHKESVTAKATSITYTPRPTCQAEGIACRTVKFGTKYPWAEAQTSEKYVVAKDPKRHVSNWIWNINTDGTHSQMYPCCGAVTNTAAHTYDETTKKCTACGYTEGATLYTVTFMADGKVYCTTKVCVGSSVSNPSAPAKEDYTFINWFTAENGKGKPFQYTYNTEGDTTYYAYYKNKFDVRFRITVNNKNYTIETLKDVPYGSLVSAPASEKYASRIPAGYYFDGWYTNQDLLTAFDFENTKITYDTWIYGKVTECTEHIWGEVAYALSDDLTSCTATRTCTRCLFAETATSVSANVTLVEAATCAKVGTATGTATFDVEWAADQSGNIELAIDPENHVNPTVTYNWTNDKTGIPNKCTATLNCSACGHKESVTAKATSITYTPRPTCQAEGIACRTVKFGTKYPWAEAQTSEKYVVAKDPKSHASKWIWNINTDGTHSQMYPCCGAVTNTAAHTYDETTKKCTACGYTEGAKTYVLTFIADGKEFCKVNVYYGSSVSKPQAPAKDGYVFKNWYTEENGQGNSFRYTYNTEGDTTYYAYYTNQLTVDFAYEDTDHMPNSLKNLQDVLYGTTISAPTFSEYAEKIPEGYYIEGWYTGWDYAKEFDFSKPITALYTEILGKLAELKGWCEIDGEWYYYYEDGTKATGIARVPYNTELSHAPNADDLAYYNANKETSKYSDAENAVYNFAEDGKLIRESGIVVDGETTRYSLDGVIAWHVGMVEVDGEYYYFGGDVNGGGNVMLTGNVYATRNTTELDMVVSGVYTFAEDGKMCKYEGLTEVDGALYYYDGYCRSKSVGVVKTADGYIYVRTTNLEVITGKQYWVSVTGESGVIKGSYTIDDNGFIKDPVLVNPEATTGIFDGYYYVDGEVQYAAGAVEIDGDIYYVRANGQIVTGCEYWVTQSSELLPAGKYTFDENGKLVK